MRRRSKTFSFHTGPRAARKNGRRDLERTCSVKLYVGSGVPSDAPGAKYAGLPVSFDSEAWWRRLQSQVAMAFPNATYLRARGSWDGGGEDSVIVEIFDKPVGGQSCRKLLGRAERLAKHLARIFKQQAVMVIASDVDGRTLQGFVTAA
jgi:hypothetical protein